VPLPPTIRIDRRAPFRAACLESRCLPRCAHHCDSSAGVSRLHSSGVLMTLDLHVELSVHTNDLLPGRSDATRGDQDLFEPRPRGRPSILVTRYVRVSARGTEPLCIGPSAPACAPSARRGLRASHGLRRVLPALLDWWGDLLIAQPGALIRRWPLSVRSTVAAVPRAGRAGPPGRVDPVIPRGGEALSRRRRAPISSHCDYHDRDEGMQSYHPHLLISALRHSCLSIRTCPRWVTGSPP